MTKRCSGCKVEKPLDSFAKNKARKDGRQTLCRDCKKEYNRKHYMENGERWSETRAASRDKTRKAAQQFVYDYLSSRVCADCGLDDIRVLEFDHLRDKTNNISYLIACGSIENLEVEIGKCDVVCRNCHIIRTYDRKPSYRNTLGV